MVTEDQKITAQELYDAILRTANRFWHNGKHFTVEMLKAEDPSYTEVAEIMKKLSVIITVLADDFDPMMGQKAFEYCELMRRMGVAIQNEDQIELTKLVDELDRRPGI